MGSLMFQCGSQLFGSQAVDNPLGDYEVWAEEAGQYQERLGAVDDPYGRRLVRKREAAGNLLAAADVANGTHGSADAAEDRDSPDGPPENRGGQAEPSHLFAARLGLEPQETGNAQGEDHKSGPHGGKQPECEENPRRVAGAEAPARRETTGVNNKTRVPTARWTRKNTAKMM